MIILFKRITNVRSKTFERSKLFRGILSDTGFENDEVFTPLSKRKDAHGSNLKDSIRKDAKRKEILKAKWEYHGSKICYDLNTIADYYRFAVSQFRKYPLAFGHSTVAAEDDAILLILLALKLPIDDGIERWSRCRLIMYEREVLIKLIERRIVERLPVAYLLHACYQQGELFYIDNRVLIPRSHIGEILHSYLSYSQAQTVRSEAVELQYDDYFPSFSSDQSTNSSILLPKWDRVHDILDLCTGSGCLAVLAAKRFSKNDPSAELHIDAVDISEDALKVAEINVNSKGLQTVISLHKGDLYDALPPAAADPESEAGAFSHKNQRQYDLILCNPPYVPSSRLPSLPAEYLHEPYQLALDGGPDGLAIVERVLLGAYNHLKDDGGIIIEIGDGKKQLEKRFPILFSADGEAQDSKDQKVLWFRTSNSESENINFIGNGQTDGCHILASLIFMGNSIRRFNICSDEKDIENKRNAAEKVIEISNSNRSDEKSLEESDPIESSSVKSVLFVTAGESNIVATSFEPEAPKDVTWRRCSVQLNAMNESKLSDPIEIEMNTDDPLVISLLPHQHTLFCERKQRVCTAVGKLQELEYLTVSTSNDDPLSNYSFRWIRYKSAELDSHYESISESENCDTYQLQREDVGFWIGILYIDLRENVGKFSTVSDSVLKECLSEKEDDKPEYSPDSKDDETKVGHEDIYRMEVTIDLESSAKENSELSIPHVVDSTPSSETTLTTPLEAEGHLEATETLAPTEIIAPSDNPSATGNEVQSIPLPETAEAQQASAAWKPILRRVGPVLAGPPRLLDMTVHLLSLNGEASGQSEPVQVAAARSQYIGGQEGCSEFWWFRISPDGRRVQLTEPTPTPAPSPDRQDDQQMDDAPSFEIVEKDPRYYRITKEDIGCTLKVKCRPVRSDDFKGEIFTSKSSSIITSFERKEDSNS